MAECRCMTPPFDFRDYDSESIGVDETNGRFGEVSIETCRICKAKWLRYHVEYEAFSGSGRWYRGLVDTETIRSFAPEQAVAILERLPWYFYGGSYFRTSGERGSGRLIVDL